MIYGAFIFRFFGVLVLWVFDAFYSLLIRKKIKTFREIWIGPKSDDFADHAAYELKQIIIGVIFILICCSLLMNVSL